MSSRFVISFNQEERQALEELARQNYREVRKQMHYMIRIELERLGLLDKPDRPQFQSNEAGSNGTKGKSKS